MSENQQGICRTGLIVLVAISLVLCSLAGGISQGTAAPALSTPFQTLPPINATLATPIGQVTPGPTPIPTIGPGQYFEQGDQPATSSMHGNDEFGWGDIEGKPDAIEIWITDENGTHYFIVSKSSDSYAGYRLRDESGKPTNERLDDGFFHLIRQMQEKIDDIDRIERQIAEKLAVRAGADAGAVLVVIAGAIACGVMTGGICFAPFAIAAFGGVGIAIGANTGARSLQDNLKGLKEDLVSIEGNLIAKFNDARNEHSSP